jgi:hypothetical protein
MPSLKAQKSREYNAVTAAVSRGKRMTNSIRPLRGQTMQPISLYEGPFPLPRIMAARPALRTTLPPGQPLPPWVQTLLGPPRGGTARGRSPMASRLRLNPRHAQGRIRLNKSVKQASVESGCWRVRSSCNRHTRQTPPTHLFRQWSLKPTGFFWVKLPLGSPHFSIYYVAMYYTV